MTNFTMIVGFVVLAIPLLTIMMGMAIYSDIEAKKVNLVTNEDEYYNRA